MQSRGSQSVQEDVAEGGDLSGYQLARDRSRKEIRLLFEMLKSILLRMPSMLKISFKVMNLPLLKKLVKVRKKICG